MVKPDAKRNYYADLEISPTADTDEIKKQFRKLARLYHPDRNPGKELEYVPKFQAIQTAHEILSDPESRTKYDAERRKLGSAPQRPPPPPRQGPQADPNWRSQYEKYSNFPPPRMRTQANQNPPRPSSYGAQPGGASRPNFANTFQRAPPQPQPQPRAPRPPPPPRQTHAKDDADLRRENYSAWARMRPGQGQQEQTWSDDDGLRKARAARDANNAHTNKPGLGRSNTSKTPPRKAAGFDPSGRLSGDWEPQAKNTSAYQPYGRSQVPSPPLPHATSHESTPQPKPDPFHHFRQGTGEDDVPYSEGARVRTPYASQGIGQKTYFNTESISRSSSMRDAPDLERQAAGKGPSPRVNTARHRSASPAGRGTANANPSTRRASAHHTGRRGATFMMDDQSSSEVSDADADTSSDTSTKPMTGETTRPKPRKTAQPGKFWRENNAAFSDSANGNQTAPESPLNGAPDQPPIFTFSNVDRNKHGARSNSSDNINTKFSPREWDGKFQGSDEWAPPTPPGVQRPGKARSPTRRTAGRTTRSGSSLDNPIDLTSSKPGTQGNPVNFSSEGFKVPPPPPNPPASAGSAGAAPLSDPEPVKFSQEKWQETFRDPSFVYPYDETSRSTSPSKPNSTFKKPKLPRGRKQSKADDKTTKTATTAVSSDASDEESEVPMSKSKSIPPQAMDSDAMDIDSESPLGASKSASPRMKRGPRMVNVPPQRPDWHDHSSIPTTPQGAVPNTTLGGIPMGPIPKTVPDASVPPPPPPPPGPPPMSNTKQKRDASLNFDSFRSAAPFAPSVDGLSGMQDLSGTLPFQSQPSDHATKTFQPRQLELPPAPKAPAPPMGNHITVQQWREYMSQMAFYQGMWYQFNGRMLEHFKARHAASAKFGTGDGQSSMESIRLLEAFGEGSGEDAAGYESYLRGMDEDVRVQKHWDVAREKHKYAIERLLNFKKQIANGLTKLLPDAL